jgi:hypothetical protein
MSEGHEQTVLARRDEATSAVVAVLLHGRYFESATCRVHGARKIRRSSRWRIPLCPFQNGNQLTEVLFAQASNFIVSEI